jgi:hypothetical protein
MNAEINSTSINDLPSVGNSSQPVQPQNISMNVSNIAQIPNTNMDQQQQQQQQQQYPQISSNQSNNITETPTNYNEIMQNLQNSNQNSGNNALPVPPQIPQSQQDPSDVSAILKSMQHMATSSNSFGLPSRDIPQQSNREDNTARPNYVPEHHKNYINEYEAYENIIDNKRKEENRQSSLEILYEQLQLPIIVALLYFLFHLPIVNNWFIKTFKSFFHSDGNMNLSGYVLKSIVFASLYYFIHKGVKYSETF